MESESQEGINLLGIDYYAALGLSRNCDAEDIRRAFRRLSLRYHPERLSLRNEQQQEGSEEDEEEDEIVANERESKKKDEQKAAFAVVAESYEVLSDPFKRAVYDQYGEAGLKGSNRPPDNCIPPYTFHGQPLRTYREFFGTENPYADLLDDLANPPLLGDCPEARGLKTKDKDVTKPLSLTLNEVFYGGVKKMKIHRVVLVGGENKGDTRRRLEATTATEEKILSIPIMPGMPAGTRIVFPEEGDQGPLKIPADVVFVTEDEPHETFRRDGANLRLTITIVLSDALTGTIVTVNTIDERVLRIPITSVITPNYVKRVPNEGLPLVEDPERRGDLLIDFDIEFPAYLPASSKVLVQRALDRQYELVDDDDNEEDESRLVRRILLDGKLYMRANKISQIFSP